jgi:hypothetical protein
MRIHAPIKPFQDMPGRAFCWDWMNEGKGIRTENPVDFRSWSNALRRRRPAQYQHLFTIYLLAALLSHGGGAALIGICYLGLASGNRPTRLLGNAQHIQSG